MAQGKTVLVSVIANRPCTVTGSVEDQTLAFASSDGHTYRAFLGISPIAELAPVTINIQAQDESNHTASATTVIHVSAGNFDYEELALEPDVSALLAPDISVPEAERLQGIFSLKTPQILWSGLFIWPYEGTITSSFAIRRLYNGELSSYHAGIDIGGEAGAPVYAAASGQVVLAETLQVRGNAVIINHGAGVFTCYYHLQDIVVSPWQQVQQGELLGHLDSTGLSTGPHLHWEMRVGGVPVDPVEWTTRVMQTGDNP